MFIQFSNIVCMGSCFLKLSCHEGTGLQPGWANLHKQVCLKFAVPVCAPVQSFQSCPMLCDPRDCSPLGSSVHGISQATILEWVAISFPRDLLQARDQTCISCFGGQILYQLSHKGSPRILEWVAYPFSRGYSWPRNQTGVSCIAGRFFANWATKEAWHALLIYSLL